jgi:hypothetical protein
MSLPGSNEDHLQQLASAGIGVTSRGALIVPNGITTSVNGPVISQGVPSWTSAGEITITGTGSNPTKGVRSKDNISYRQVGDKEWEIVLTYIQGTGSGLSGSGDYLITLPNGLSFDTTLPNQQIYTGNIQTPTWEHAHNIIPNGNGLINNGSVAGHTWPIVYSATKFRVLAITYGGGGGVICWGSGFYTLGGDDPKLQMSFTFTSA